MHSGPQDVEKVRKLWEFQEGERQFLGISAEGRLLAFMHKSRLTIKNLENIDTFGPSVATMQEWMTGDDSARLLAQHKAELSKWPLLW